MEMQIIEHTETEDLTVEKNSRGYNWKYKLVGKVEEQMTRLDKIEEDLKKRLNLTVIKDDAA